MKGASMATVKRVESRCTYPIECGRGMAYSCLLDLLREMPSEKAPQVAIVTDKEVNGLHHTTFISELESRGVKPTFFR